MGNIQQARWNSSMIAFTYCLFRICFWYATQVEKVESGGLSPTPASASTSKQEKTLSAPSQWSLKVMEATEGWHKSPNWWQAKRRISHSWPRWESCSVVATLSGMVTQPGQSKFTSTSIPISCVKTSSSIRCGRGNFLLTEEFPPAASNALVSNLMLYGHRHIWL